MGGPKDTVELRERLHRVIEETKMWAMDLKSILLAGIVEDAFAFPPAATVVLPGGSSFSKSIGCCQVVDGHEIGDKGPESDCQWRLPGISSKSDSILKLDMMVLN